jgi:uncharacterized protein YfiM (DUF2279 family)
MRWLLRLVLAAVVTVPVLLLAAVWLALEPQPLVTQAPAITPAHIERAKRLLDRNDPRRMRPGVLRTVVVSQEDLELTLNYLVNRFARATASSVLQEGAATVRASVALPANPLGRYVNLDASFEEGSRLPSFTALRIGRLPVPAFLCNWWLRRVLTDLEGSTEYRDAADVIKKVRARPGVLQVEFEWSDAAASQIKSALVPPKEQARWRVYQARLVQLTTSVRPARPMALEELLSPLVQLAQQRSGGGDAVEENRAMLVVLAFYANGKGLAALVPSAKSWPVPALHAITLAGRTDFPQHFTISAALAASAGSPLSDAVGVYKEVDDARGGSGFSFNDIAADRAGTRFGELATTRAAGLVRLHEMAARGLRETDLLPDVRDLPEFMPEAEFRRRFGGIGQPAYMKMVADIERRIAALPLYR